MRGRRPHVLWWAAPALGVAALLLLQPAWSLNKVTNWGFENATEPGNGWTAGGTAGATQNSFARSTAQKQEGTYSFFGQWTGSGSNSGVSRTLTQSYTTPSSPVQARLRASYWRTNTGNSDSQAFTVRLMNGATPILTAVSDTTFRTTDTAWQTGTSAVAQLAANTTYTVEIQWAAVLDSGESEGRYVDNVQLQVSPSGLSASAPAGGTTAALTWAASTNGTNGPNLRGTNPYNVYRGTTPGGATALSLATTTSYTDATTVGNTTYYFQVTDFDTGNAESPGSIEVSVLTRPGTPGTPTFSGVTSSSITVNWASPTGGAASYRVERAPDSGGSPGTWVEVATGVLSPWTDSGRSCATTYWYRVRGTNATGDGAYSGSASQATAACGTTTVGNGTNPTNATIAPGAGPTPLDAFTLQTSSGSDTVTAATVSLAAGTAARLAKVGIWSGSTCTGTEYGSVTNPATDTPSISLGAGISATTALASYYVCVTPLAHASMPAPPGATYAVTGTVTAITSTNAKTYSDTASATVTIDNLSPSNATWGTITPGNAQVVLNWTNPGDADFSQVVILRNTAAIGDVPVEGTTYAQGGTIGTSTVRYVGNLQTFTDTPLTNGTDYWYRIYAQDANGNYSQTGVGTGPHRPIAGTTTTVGDGTNPTSAAIAPGASATPLDTFTLQTSTGTDTVTAATVTLAAGTAAGLSRVGIWSGSACTGTEYGFATSPASDAVAISLTTSIPVSTTLASYYVCVTPKTHADMPAPPGSSYAVTGTVTTITSTNSRAYNDSASATVTIDNLSPSNAAWGTVTAANGQVVLNWTNPGDADFSQVVVLRNTASITDVPVEGTTYAQGGTIGTSAVRYVGSLQTFTDTGLTNGTDYWYRIYARDANGNYSQTGAATGPHRPTAGNTTTVGNGTNPSNATIAPGASATPLDAFTLQTNTGTDAVSAATVTLASGTATGLSRVGIWSGSACTGTEYGFATNPASDVVAITLGTGITASTTATPYYVCVTPKAHALMPAPPGSTWAVTGTVTAITSTNAKTYADTASATVTIDNLSPSNATWGTITTGSGQVVLNWTNPASDFSQVVVLRSTAWITAAPTEGTAYAQGNNIGTATVVYAGNLQTHTDTTVSNNEIYYYKVFARDAYMNYATGAQTGPHRPAANGTAIGTASAFASSCRQITVLAPFAGDADADGSVKVEYNTTNTWPGTTSCATVSGPSPRTCLVSVPNPASSYFVRVTFTDADGTSGTNGQVLGPIVVDACAGNSAAPTILFLSPARGAVVGGTDRFKVQVWDADGVTAGNVLWGLDGASPASGVTLNSSYACNVGSQTGCQVFEFDVNTTVLSTGPHSVTVKATDSASPASVGYASLPFSVANSGGVPRGGGNLLRRSHGSQLCIDCHNLPTHSSQGTTGKYGSWAIDCVTCHTPHRTRNIYLVGEAIDTPNSGRHTVDFRADDRTGGTNPNYSYLGNTAGAPTNYTDGVCETCHTRTSYYRNDTSGANNHTHNQTKRCVDCHQHGKAFAGSGCNGCHKAPPTVGKHGAHDQVWDSTDGNTASSYDETVSHATPTQYGFACSKCHAGTHLNDTRAGTLADPYQVQIAFDATASPKNAGATYTAGTAQAPDQGPSGSYWRWTDGSCGSSYCHSNAAPLGGFNSPKPVTWNQAAATTCVSCHGTRAWSDTGGVDSDLSSTHARHIKSTSSETGTYAFRCDECHAQVVRDNPNDPWLLSAADLANKALHVDGLRSVAFSSTSSVGGFDQSAGSYAQGPGYACSNTYCHSNGQDRVAPFTSGPSIAWGTTAAADCSSCHGGNASAAVKMGPSNDHAAHMDQVAYLGTNFACGRCHATTVAAANDRAITTLASHVNGTADVSMVDGGTYAGSATKTCTNVYCHSNGTETPDYVNTNLDWDAGFAKANDCLQCHGTAGGAFTAVYGEPNYTERVTTSDDVRNSHSKHVSGTLAVAKTQCVDCHAASVNAAGALVTAGTHLNKAVEITTGGKIGTWTAAGETCGNITCHGGNSASWGGPALGCTSCHGGAADVNNWNVSDGTISKVNTGTEWTTYGHGNAAAAFAGANVCLYCHDDSVSHATPTNPFRLRGAANASGVTSAYNAASATNGNDVCINCHDADAGTRYGIDPDGASAGYALKKAATSFMDAWHQGADHSATQDGGKRCWDCHDPHGDGTNIFMIGSDTLREAADDYGLTGTRSTTNAIFTSSAAGGYAKAATPFTGICQVCHTSTSYYRADGTLQTHNAGSDCITCHAHQQPPGNAFKGAGACKDCHSARTGSIPRARIIGGAAGSEGDDFIRPSRHVSSGSTTSIVTDFDCILCHAEGDVTSSGTTIKTVAANHGADGGTSTVDLRNVDSSGGTGIQVAWPGKRLATFTATTASRDGMDSFCMGCHDADGASNVTVNATNNGMTTSTTGAAARRLTPFNTSDNIRNAKESGALATSRTRVINVKDQFNSTNQVGKAWASHHNLNQFTKRYSTRNATYWPNPAWTTYTTKEGQNIQTAGETAGLHCSDCHLNEANAHGTRNTWYMLSDMNGADTAFTNVGYTTSTDICSKCHSRTTYGVGNTDGTNSRTDAHNGAGARCDNIAWDMQPGFAYLGYDSVGQDNHLSCLGCHGGLEPGMIHGTNATYEPWDPTPDGTGVTKRFRFMGTGGSMRWYSPTGAAFTANTPTSDTSWEGTSAFGCYTVAAADTYGACTNHGTGRSGSTPNRARPLNY